MHAIALRPDLQQVLERDAELQSKTVSDLVNEAVARYLRERDREKLVRENTAYERMHATFLPDLLGQWVAIHDGQVVDQDADASTLHARVRAQCGRTPVLIRQVEEHPAREIRRRTPSITEDPDEIDAEQRAFEELYADLLRSHRGQWVAVYGGQGGDAGDDDVALHHRILHRSGDAPVLLTRVHDRPIEEFRIRSPRLDPPGP